MNSEIFTAIIASVSIGTIISAIIVWSTGQKTNELNKITQERKQWRDDLREIGIEVEKAINFFQLKKVLVKLKVRLNTNGYYNIHRATDPNYLNDDHLWKLILKIENNNKYIIKDENELEKRKLELEESKRTLINLLACLLKYDWERSKREVVSNDYKKRTYIYFMASFLLLSALIIIKSGPVSSHNIIISNSIYIYSEIMITIILGILFVFWVHYFKKIESLRKTRAFGKKYFLYGAFFIPYMFVIYHILTMILLNKWFAIVIILLLNILSSIEAEIYKNEIIKQREAYIESIKCFLR